MIDSNNKRIAKNTMMLYLRQMVTLVIGLYTSRVVLSSLGVSDYGIYNVVGGFVGMLAFLNGILSTSSQRFFSFNLTDVNRDYLKSVFSNILIVHIALIVVIFIIAETVGLWFVVNKLNIPEGREYSALCVYEFSVMTTMASIFQIPFMASLIAHEKMSIYAYMSIYDAVAKLLIVFILLTCSVDRLIMYGALMFTVQISSVTIYIFYCKLNYEECTLKLQYKKEVIKEVTSFSSWTVLSSVASIGNVQGVNILLNIFCGTVINAARGVAVQVNNIVMSFVRNFQVASNPQIVKMYANDSYGNMKRLAFNSSKLSAYLLIFLMLPVFVNIEFILHVWLGEYPEHTPAFLRIIQIQSIIQAMSGPIVTIVFSTGKLKYPNILNAMCNVLAVGLAYILLKNGLAPEYAFTASVLPWAIEGYIDSYYASKYSKFSQWSYYSDVYGHVLIVLLLSAPLPILIKMLYSGNEILGFLINCVLCVLSTCISVFYAGIDRQMRMIVFNIVKSKVPFLK